VVVGAVEIEPAPDAVGVLCEYAEAYPDQSDADWAPYRAAYPHLFAGSRWRLPCVSHVIRSDDTTILVDTGVGPPGLWSDWEPEEEGMLPGSLAALGIVPDDVDIVFFTHVHVDHVGWNTDLEGVPLFPRARHVVHADALADALRKDDAHIGRCIVPLRDRFEPVRGDVELAPGVVAFETPGHSPGHLALRISSEGEEATFVADAVPHPALLDRPEWVFAFDEDSAANAPTRAALVENVVRGGGLVICGHYPGSGIGRLESHEGRVVWTEADRASGCGSVLARGRRVPRRGRAR
jgi:glyoxylase-like metal-dependent hydrolase (beta-lactamase superfamily II)